MSFCWMEEIPALLAGCEICLKMEVVTLDPEEDNICLRSIYMLFPKFLLFLFKTQSHVYYLKNQNHELRFFAAGQ